jgi:phospholipase A-2-activating protein
MAELWNGLIVTGGFDATCVVWSCVNGELKKEREIFGNSDFIYSVCASPVNENWFLTASKDRKIFVFDSVTGDRVMDFTAASCVHSGPICSITPVGESLIAAGSWDGSFSLWIADSGELVWRRENAGSHAIVVAYVPDVAAGGYIVTGSQDKALKIWSVESGELVSEILNAHDDIIRSISVFKDIIFTASNDCTVKLWSLSMSPELSLHQIGSVLGHGNFIFSVSTSPQDACEFYTASEDKTCRVWSTDRLVETQSIPHPGTVWFASKICGNIITGCSDGFVRSFSNQSELHASVQELEAYDTLCAASASGGNQIDPSTVPPESDMNRYRGKKLGEIKMFKDVKNEVFAYQWTAMGAWEKVGLVTGGTGPKRKFFSGDQYFAQAYYDYVFDVELGESGRMALLPINQSDNPLVAAEKFCARESINKSNLQQIIDFIRSNIKGGRDITESLSSPRDSIQTSPHFPLITPFLFKDAKWASLVGKLHEVSPLSATELSRVDHVIAQLQTGQPVIEFLASDGLIIFSKLATQIPQEFVVYDIWRLCILNITIASELFKHADGGSQYLLTAARQLKANVSNNTGLCCARFLSNLFANSVSKWALMERLDIVVDALVGGCRSDSGSSKPTQIACASALANIASAMTEKRLKFSNSPIIENIYTLVDSGLVANDPDVLYRLSVALGCCAIVAPNEKGRIKEISRNIDNDVVRDILTL